MSIGEILLRSRYQPLKRVLSYDVFNTGFNGWMTLMPNFTEYPDFGTMSECMNTSCQPASMILVCSALKCCAAQTASTFVVSMRHGAMNVSSILPATSL